MMSIIRGGYARGGPSIGSKLFTRFSKPLPGLQSQPSLIGSIFSKNIITPPKRQLFTETLFGIGCVALMPGLLRSVNYVMLSNDQKKILEMLKDNPYALSYASSDLRNNPSFIKQAVALNGQALGFASSDIRGNKEIVLESIRHFPEALQYATNKLKEDPGFMIEAFRVCSCVLRYASLGLRDDLCFMRQAVTEDGLAIEYASEHLCANKHLVTLAVKQNGYALEFAHTDLQNDPDVVFAAFNSIEGNVLRYAGHSLINTPEFLRLVATKMEQSRSDQMHEISK